MLLLNWLFFKNGNGAEVQCKTCRTNDKGVPHDARDAEAAAKLEGHVNVEVGRESVADAKHQQEHVREQDHEAATKPEGGVGG